MPFYPTKFIKEMNGTRKEHESISILPPIDIYKVIQAIKLLSLSSSFKNKYQLRDDYVFETVILDEKLDITIGFYAKSIFYKINDFYDINDHGNMIMESLQNVFNNKIQNLSETFFETLLSKFILKKKFIDNHIGEFNQIKYMIGDYFTPRSILDIGGGDGELLSMTSKHYNIPPKKTFLLDGKGKFSKNYVLLDSSEKIFDHSIDVILLFNVLHHIPKNERENILKEVNRILSVKGIVIIKDHDYNYKDINFKIYLELLHMFYYYMNNENVDPLILMSKFDIEKLFSNHSLIKKKYFSHQKNNYQRIFYMSFNKIKNP